MRREFPLCCLRRRQRQRQQAAAHSIQSLGGVASAAAAAAGGRAGAQRVDGDADGIRDGWYYQIRRAHPGGRHTRGGRRAAIARLRPPGHAGGIVVSLVFFVTEGLRNQHWRRAKCHGYAAGARLPQAYLDLYSELRAWLFLLLQALCTFYGSRAFAAARNPASDC